MDTNKDNLYARWLAGDLNSKEEKDLLDTEEIQDLEKIIQTTDTFSLPKYDAAAGYANFKTLHINKPKVKQATTFRKLIPWVAAAAASVLLLVTSIHFLTNKPNYIEVGNKATLAHTFQDQSSVVLNAGSQLFFDESEWQEQRTLKLIGEALFSVQKGKPFIVSTNNGTIEVMGTSFNVRAFDAQLRVECYTGKVSVKYANNQSIILTEGEAINGRLGNLSVKNKISQEKPLWTTGNARFYETPVYRVFEELERQYDIEVQVSKISRPFSGTFRTNNLEQALEAICKPMGLTYIITAGRKQVVISDANSQ
ncbi:MAG: FecR family protein [Saprospiraceae bacterium]